MPDVRISVTEAYLASVKDKGRLCCKIRVLVALTFDTDIAGVATKLETYAPGCDERRPHLSVSVTIDKEGRRERQQELAQTLVGRVKTVAAEESDMPEVGQVKVVIDLGTRTSATETARFSDNPRK